ncbi:MAG TPA: ABC transporter permease [Candidatus Lachnoclostridium stercoravium]|uniref:ABC transporter permease n=1 Tax=Candidatus Lachnoclostridium stercoravium TaxID=2838633 RepID=A0A9D2HHN0_9FIRM|nr:ABC transporter permease [Candidatus Lachnoclostridium stercoravium]
MEEKKSRSQFLTVMKALSRNKMAIVGLIILIILVFAGTFAHVIAPYDYAAQDLQNAFQHPNAQHLFGTDEFGRDIFSRIIYGARMSLLVGFVSVGIAVIVGGALGAVAGYYGKRIDNIIMRLMDILLAVPQTLLAIAIVAALGTGLVNLMIAVGISSVPTYARIVRASVLTIREEEYIEAARASGTSNTKIIMKHILPNCVAPVIVQVTLGIASAILTAAGMSFIGLGIQPPEAEWGNMLSSGRDYIRGYSYMTMFPGLAIVITVLSLNLLGDGLRDALDPKLRN